MTDDFKNSGLFCQHKIGVFLIKECCAPATHRCSVCNLALCDKHFKIENQVEICPSCYSRKRNTCDYIDHNSSPFINTSFPSSTPHNSWTGGGGTFAGAGSQSSWDSESAAKDGSGNNAPSLPSVSPTLVAGVAAAELSSPSEADGFNEQDLAAFDKVATADQEIESDHYDS